MRAAETNVFPRLLDLAYPNIERGEGVRLFLDRRPRGPRCLLRRRDGRVPRARRDRDRRGSGASRRERIAYVYNHHFTNEPQERLAARLIETAAPEMARCASPRAARRPTRRRCGSSASTTSTAARRERWRVITQAQAYHGALMGALALTGRRASSALRRLPAAHCTCPRAPGASTRPARQRWRSSIGCVEEAGPETIAAFVCEPVSAAALPATRRPTRSGRASRSAASATAS